MFIPNPDNKTLWELLANEIRYGKEIRNMCRRVEKKNGLIYIQQKTQENQYTMNIIKGKVDLNKQKDILNILYAYLFKIFTT